MSCLVTLATLAPRPSSGSSRSRSVLLPSPQDLSPISIGVGPLVPVWTVATCNSASVRSGHRRQSQGSRLPTLSYWAFIRDRTYGAGGLQDQCPTLQYSASSIQRARVTLASAMYHTGYLSRMGTGTGSGMLSPVAVARCAASRTGVCGGC